MRRGNVAAHNINSTLLVQSILRQAKAKPDAKQWLIDQHAAALEAVQRGDEFITSANTEGGGSSAERAMTATQMLELYEAALQVKEMEDEAAAAGGSIPGSVRYADFSHQPCTLG